MKFIPITAVVFAAATITEVDAYPKRLSCASASQWGNGFAIGTNMDLPEDVMSSDATKCDLNVPSQVERCTEFDVTVDAKSSFTGSQGFKIVITDGTITDFDTSGQNSENASNQCQNAVEDASNKMWKVVSSNIESGTMTVYALCGQKGEAVYSVSKTISVSGGRCDGDTEVPTATPTLSPTTSPTLNNTGLPPDNGSTNITEESTTPPTNSGGSEATAAPGLLFTLSVGIFGVVLALVV